jgi:hypothetical protein
LIIARKGPKDFANPLSRRIALYFLSNSQVVQFEIDRFAMFIIQMGKRSGLFFFQAVNPLQEVCPYDYYLLFIR